MKTNPMIVSAPWRMRRHLCLLAANGLLLSAIGWRMRSAAAQTNAALNLAGTHGPSGQSKNTPSETVTSNEASEQRPSSLAFYVAVGPRLQLYHPDAETLGLQRDGSDASDIALPAAIQYVWPHPSLPLLYVAYSDRSGKQPGQVHGVQVLRIDADGRLHAMEAPLVLDNRPINISLDPLGRFLLIAFNAPSDVAVYPLDKGGVIGPVVRQALPVDAGIYAHQVRVAPDNRTVILVTRGNDAQGDKHEDPGALKVFDMNAAGQLALRQSIAPNGGYGFGPRHLDFGRDQATVYVSMERENKLETFVMRAGSLETLPRFSTTTLGQPAIAGLRQLAGAIHVSPDGRFVYIANRADSRKDLAGQSVFAGGENTLAVFEIDAASGAPHLKQTIDTDKFHPRTFSIDPTGKMLVTAAIQPMPVSENGHLRIVPAGLTIFGINADGTLRYDHEIAIQAPGQDVFWCGMVRYHL